MDGVGERDMLYNRVGFCVLQPWRECAGRPFRGETPDGPVGGVLPDLVAPQGFANGVYVPLFPSVSRLEVDYAAGPTAVFEFEGDLFETEDQRNWTDASLKTYCTPLALGFPHELKQGEAKRQTVTVYADGETVGAGERRRGAAHGRRRDRRARAAGRARRCGGCAVGRGARAAARARAGASPLRRSRCRRPRGPAVSTRSLALCRATGAALELALFLREGDDLAPLRDALAGADVARVLVAPEGAQTVTPEETTPPELVRAARDGLALDGVPFAGGTDMYFCELNRTKPQVDAMDGVFWSLNAQVHAFDDISVLETPEAQGEQVRTARAFAPGKSLFVGPVTLKRRYNVNATVADAEPDPPDGRQAEPIGAAWTAASATNLVAQGASAITYFETTGVRGVVDGEPFPLYRVLADVCSLRGGEVLECETTRPLEVAGLAVRRNGATTLIAANLTPFPRTVELRWLGPETTIDLAPYEVARIDR